MLGVLKFLWDSKLLTTASGYAAMLVVGYMYLFLIQPLAAEVTDVKSAVDSLQRNQLEERMDATYAALCMNPGDQAVLERIRDLQQAYDDVVNPDTRGDRYDPPECSLLMKLR